MIELRIIAGLCFIACALSFPIHTNRVDRSMYNVANTTRDGRPSCPLINWLRDERLPSCYQKSAANIDLTANSSSKNFFLIRSVLPCFGSYDVAYEICKYFNVSSFDVPRYDAASFCAHAAKSFECYEFPRQDLVLGDWPGVLRQQITNSSHCNNMCVLDKDVNVSCQVMVAALDAYSRLSSEASKTLPLPQVNDEDSMKDTAPQDTQSAISSLKGAAATSEMANSPLLADPQNLVSKTSGLHFQADSEKPVSTSRTNDTKNVAALDVANKVVKDNKQILSELPEVKMDADLGDEDAGELGSDRQLEEMGEPELSMDKSEQTKEQPDVDESKLEEDKGTLPKTFQEQNTLVRPGMDDSDTSNMATYFILMMGGALVFYFAFHNKNKLLALALEGRKTTRRGARPSSAAYSKLHSNLEETIACGPASTSATHVLY